MPKQHFKAVLDEEGKYVGFYFVGDGWEPNDEQDTIVYLAPRFELGAKPLVGGRNPTLGMGIATAEYTVEEFTNGTRIDLDIYISNAGGNAGVGTGSHELYLPDELVPAKEIYSGHVNLWVGGGGISEFDGSVKWTLRNQTKGPKLIFTFNGVEWDGRNPKCGPTSSSVPAYDTSYETTTRYHTPTINNDVRPSSVPGCYGTNSIGDTRTRRR